MDLKNTFKSRIRENKIGADIYLAQIDNYTNFTDTISKPVGEKFVQFYFCTKGGAMFHFENEEILLMQENQALLLFNPKQKIPINISLSKKSKLIIIVITIQLIENIFNLQKHFLPFFKENTYNLVLEKKIFGISEKLIINQLEEYALDSHFENLYLSLKINELLIHLFSESKSSQGLAYSIKDEELSIKINKIKEILLENISHPPTLKELSKESGLSEYKIKEGFKKLYGKTISNFILDIKLEIGKEKLDMKVKQVKEIAYDLGYENPSHFIEAFKKKYGITPKQWMMK